MLENNIRAVTQTVMITSQQAEGNNLMGNNPPNSRMVRTKTGSNPVTNHKKKKKEPPQFTPLNVSYERLLPIIRDLLEFKWLAPIQMDLSQRNISLRCDDHRNHGHECDAQFPGGPLTTRQLAEYSWMSSNPTPLMKIGQSLLCTESSTQGTKHVLTINNDHTESIYN